MLLQNIGFIQRMFDMRKLFYETKDAFYELDEDVVGWYLIVYKDKSKNLSIEDHLFDSYENALQVAKEDFNIPEDKWRMLYN